MKHARKMVLVDYDRYNNNINQRKEISVKPKPLFNLDKSMYEILQNSDLSDYEKHKLYTSKLNKYLFFINQQTKENVKKEPLFDIIKPQPKPEPETKPEPKPEFNESDNDTFSDKNTSNEEFFDLSHSEEENDPKWQNDTLKKLTSQFDSPSTSTPYTTPSSKKKKRKYMRKKAVPRDGSPVKLRSSHPKNQLGGWFSFNDIIKNYK
jgi:hypothetical protein